MDQETLRAVQAPIKQSYRDDPGSARVAAHAVATVEIAEQRVTVPGWAGPLVAGLHRAAGGSGELACSADILLESVAACAGVTLASVATALAIPLSSARVHVDGVWDARGTLGVSREAPVGLTDVTVRFELVSDADPAQLDKLVSLTERYCVILQTLLHPPKLSVIRV